MINSHPRILAIDDTPANLFALGATLDNEFELQIATSGLMGLALAKASAPDLILLNVIMPDMDGYETCRQLKADPNLRTVPVIFISALSDAGEAEIAFLTLGAADYITKPVNVGIARHRIRNLLEREQFRKKMEAYSCDMEEMVQALKESNAFNQTILDSVAAHVAVVNCEGVILAVNEPWRRFSIENGIESGKSAPNTDVGANYFGVCGGGADFPCRDAIDARDGIRAVMEGRRPSFSMEYSCDSPTELRWFMMTVVPRVQDRTSGVAITHTNITERKRIEAALVVARDQAESAARSKAAFLANMSHEIRTPMNGIIGVTALMLDDELSAPQRQRMEIISSSAESLLTLINNVLDLSKIDAGKLEVEHIDFNLRELLHDLGQLFSILAAEKGLSFAQDVEPSVPEWVNGDPIRLKQILNNFLANALKFTDIGIVGLKARMVETSDRSITLRFEVSDTGIGISPEFLGKIFSAFEQADASTNRRYGGTGLGLAISKQLTELMGGRIAVAANENGGSLFSVLLCVGVADEAAQPPAQPARRKRADFACRLLLAEDDPVNQLVAIGTLQNLGYDDITVAVNGQEVLEKLAEGRFDAILMDVQMPVMNGFQTTAILRKQACTLPIIAMTANALRGDREQCIAAGMNDYVSKPISRDILATVLARWTMPDATSVAQAQSVHADEVDSAGSDALVPQPLASLTFDRLRLMDLLENDEKLMSGVLTVALERMPIAIASLEAAFHDGKNDEAERYAHSIKGSAANVGALALSAIALQVECLAAEGGHKAFGTLLETLKDEFASFRAAVSDVGCAPGDCPDAKGRD